MTDQDNLRDRIARVLDIDAGLTDPGDEKCLTLSSLRAAQAIIDEFGLQVLEVGRIDLINGTVASYQIVGEWGH